MQFKSIAGAVGGCVVALLVTLGAQSFFTFKAVDDACETAIQQSAATNADGAAAVLRYRETCEMVPSEMPTKAPVKTLAECLSQVGSDSFSEAIHKANDSVSVPATLRWL